MSLSHIDQFGDGREYLNLFDGLTLFDGRLSDPKVTVPGATSAIQPEPALGTDSVTTTASHVSAGLHINLIPDASVANAPATFASEIRQAADIIEAAFSDPITLNIRYGWGTYNNQVDSSLIGGNFAEGGDNFQTHQNVAYSTLRTWLTSDASSSEDNAAVSHIPNTLSNNFYVTSAQLKALGHFSGNANDVDGFIGWGTAWTSNFIDGALHELTHAMGRIFQDGLHYVMDLFRFDAAGHFQWTGRQPAYLSIDGGASKLADFGVSTDFGDFLPGGVQGADPFNERVSGNNALTAVDITNMDVIGFNRAGQATPTTDDFASSLSDVSHPFGVVGPTGAATGNLEVPGDHDWFRVQLVAGTTYLVNLQGQHSGAGSLQDPYLRIHNSTGALVAENDDVQGASNRDSQLTYSATTSGTYYLDVGAFNDSLAGTYLVSINGNSDDFANSLSDVTHPFGQVSVGGVATGTLEVTADRDWFRVQLVAGTSYTINLQGQQTGGGTLEDPYLRVHNSAGAVLAENDDIILGIQRDSQLTFQAAASGTYYLEAGAFNDSYTGTYKISVSGSAITDDFRDSLTDTTAPFGSVAVGGSSTGTLETTGDRDWFAVQLNAGTTYQADLQGLHAGGGTLEDPYLRIHNSSGAVIAENDDIDLGVDRDSHLTFQATTSGTYYIEAGAFADNYTGTYRASISSFGPGSVAINDVSITEGNFGVKFATFTVTRSGGAAAFGVNFTTLDGSATVADHDYFANSGTLNFAAGVNTQTISVAISGDTKIEANENFFVSLSGATNGVTISDNFAFGTIVDDDGNHARDFDADAHSDILWQRADGLPAMWQMNGLSNIGGGLIGFNPGSSMHEIASGDFNGDGHADILWQGTDGTPAMWLMNGTSIIGQGVIGFNPGPNVHAITTGDFNGDGNADILWQASDGTAAMWLMNGMNIIGQGVVGFNPGANMHAIASGDFNGDGNADILWQGTDGTPAMWLMNGMNIVSQGLIGFNPGPSMHAITTGDFDGDGKADILWQATNGTPAMWLMNGMNIASQGVIGFNPGPTMHAVATGDFNNDHHSDIVWHGNDGTSAIWEMNGMSIASQGVLGFNPGADWHIVA